MMIKVVFTLMMVINELTEFVVVVALRDLFMIKSRTNQSST